ncbi:OmpH family outer membrane protein [Megamonas hypermegale]|uniref:OmpH family outer membrane protein n=1 Tax=Megamonas hypermegale TaxID=158847 RepID=UPI0025A4473A|nr:OmpH family outer membrane protein [Megamonas hypermegale]MDM8142596.1 OmpH family outer membrane protein [Megamonas hypermegale]
MKKQFLAIICSALFALGIGSTASAAEVYQPAANASVATINYQYVLANLPESKSIQQSMAKLSEEAQKDFEQSVNEKMNPEEIQKVRIRVATELRQKQIDLVKPVQEKINNAIQQVAQQHGYTVIISADVALYTSADVTQEVLNALK